MPPSDEETLARGVLGTSLSVAPGESVVVEAWSHALPWARAFVVEARRRGADVVLALEDEEAYFRSLALAGRGAFPRPSAGLARVADAYVCFDGPEAFSRLLGLPTGEFAAVLDRHPGPWLRVARQRRLRAARVVAPDITATLADRYGVDREEWEREVLRASLVPPRRIAAAALRLVRHLRGRRRLRVRHPNGTDLVVQLRPGPGALDDGRVGDDDRTAGRVWTQVPGGRIVFDVRTGTPEGRWEANRPVYDRFDDPSVSLGATFRFRRGRLAEYGFDHGGDSFGAAYRRAGVGRLRLADLSFGLNPALRSAPELAEFALGSVTIRLGAAPRSGGWRGRFQYRTTLTGADVEVDGRPLLDTGELQ